jgi:hypothetical protein
MDTPSSSKLAVIWRELLFHIKDCDICRTAIHRNRIPESFCKTGRFRWNVLRTNVLRSSTWIDHLRLLHRQGVL